MSDHILVIGNKAYSSWSLRAWLPLRVAVGASGFKEVLVDLADGGPATESQRAALRLHSPSGKVPALVENGLTIWDSLAICERLAELHPKLWPADPAARAVARSVSAEMHSGFSTLRSLMPMNVRKKLEAGLETTDIALAGDIARIDALWCACRTQYGQTGPFLFGAFSIADAMYAPVALRFLTYKPLGLSAEALAYVDTIVGMPDIQDWIAGAHADQHVIAALEAK